MVTRQGNVRVVPVPGLSRREALAYLSSRLTDYPDQRIEALDLGEDLDGLPLALGQATAVINARQQGCREYRAALAERPHMTGVDRASATVLATWSLAAECAHELPPAGLAWPTLVLAAMMDHHGMPGAVLTSPAACSYIAGRPSTAGGADQNMVRAAINNLAAVGLITIDPGSPVRTVQMHASVQAAVRAYLPAADLEQVVLAAADALLETWPEGEAGRKGRDHRAGAARSGPAGLRHGAAASRRRGAVEDRGPSAAVPGRAVARAQQAGRRGHHVLEVHGGHQHPAARPRPRQRRGGQGQARRGLRGGREVRRGHRGVPDRAGGPGANQGPEHPETIAARGHLAHAYQSAGRPADAIALYERTVADSARLLGPAHPVTLDARASLAETYQASGQPGEAIAAYETLLADAERQLGAGHPTTLSARASLGAAYAANGQAKDAIEQYERAAGRPGADARADHPDTIAARASLASAYRSAGKQKDAIAQYERVLADRERV